VESPTSFPTQSLIPKPLESAKSADEFLSRLGGFDSDMTKIKEEAEGKGAVIRYVGSLNVETTDVKVGLETYVLSVLCNDNYRIALKLTISLST
jgi:homoserine dehydrogenase